MIKSLSFDINYIIAIYRNKIIVFNKRLDYLFKIIDKNIVEAIIIDNKIIYCTTNLLIIYDLKTKWYKKFEFSNVSNIVSNSKYIFIVIQNIVKIIDFNGNEIKVFINPYNIKEIQLLRDANLFIVSDNKQFLSFWDIETKKILQTYKTKIWTKETINLNNNLLIFKSNNQIVSFQNNNFIFKNDMFKLSKTAQGTFIVKDNNHYFCVTTNKNGNIKKWNLNLQKAIYENSTHY